MFNLIFIRVAFSIFPLRPSSPLLSLWITQTLCYIGVGIVVVVGNKVESLSLVTNLRVKHRFRKRLTSIVAARNAKQTKASATSSRKYFKYYADFQRRECCCCCHRRRFFFSFVHHCCWCLKTCALFLSFQIAFISYGRKLRFRCSAIQHNILQVVHFKWGNIVVYNFSSSTFEQFSFFNFFCTTLLHLFKFL